MNTNTRKKISSFLLCSMLITAMAFSTAGCNGSASRKDSQVSETGTETSSREGSVLGEGSMQFTFTVTDPEGNETEFEIHTDKETVGEALTELGLIEGEEGEFGLYVKTVNGITADYDKDGIYWAFYINGEYAQTGVDSTAVTEGDTYSFKAEKG